LTKTYEGGIMGGPLLPGILLGFNHAVLNVVPSYDFSREGILAFTGTTGISTYLCLLVTNSGRGISLQRAT